MDIHSSCYLLRDFIRLSMPFCLLVFKIIRRDKCRIRSSVFMLFNVIIHFDSLVYI